MFVFVLLLVLNRSVGGCGRKGFALFEMSFLDPKKYYTFFCVRRVFTSHGIVSCSLSFATYS